MTRDLCLEPLWPENLNKKHGCELASSYFRLSRWPPELEFRCTRGSRRQHCSCRCRRKACQRRTPCPSRTPSASSTSSQRMNGLRLVSRLPISYSWPIYDLWPRIYDLWPPIYDLRPPIYDLWRTYGVPMAYLWQITLTIVSVLCHRPTNGLLMEQFSSWR